MPRLFTIGYESLLPPALVAELLHAGVERLIDVRYRPQSRRPGMSKTRLGELLAVARDCLRAPPRARDAAGHPVGFLQARPGARRQRRRTAPSRRRARRGPPSSTRWPPSWRTGPRGWCSCAWRPTRRCATGRVVAEQLRPAAPGARGRRPLSAARRLSPSRRRRPRLQHFARASRPGSRASRPAPPPAPRRARRTRCRRHAAPRLASAGERRDGAARRAGRDRPVPARRSRGRPSCPGPDRGASAVTSTSTSAGAWAPPSIAARSRSQPSPSR